jgi:hypothetical protein
VAEKEYKYYFIRKNLVNIGSACVPRCVRVRLGQDCVHAGCHCVPLQPKPLFQGRLVEAQLRYDVTAANPVTLGAGDYGRRRQTLSRRFFVLYYNSKGFQVLFNKKIIV